MTRPTPNPLLATLFAAADAVAEVIAHTTDWGPSGQKVGQYAFDLVADQACLDALSGFRTLSEESGIVTPQGAPEWPMIVLDPLDGSTNASRSIPRFATALCAVDADGPLCAVVVNHGTGERFAAERGAGATRNGVPIRPSEVTSLSEAFVGVSGLPSHDYGWDQFRALGASAPDLCDVATGVFDAWCDMNDGHGAWDYLAAVFIVQEAGGVVDDVYGRDLVVLEHGARRAPIAAGTSELLEALRRERLQ